MYYELVGNQKYAEFTPVDESDERKVYWTTVGVGDPLPPLQDWEPAQLTEYRGDGPKLRKSRKLPDCDGRYISHKAKEALSDIWDKHVSLYPVFVQEAPDPRYYMMVCQTVLDCLDLEKSEFARRSNGVPYLLKHWVFDESAVGDAEIFRFVDRFPKSAMGYENYVSEEFVRRVTEAKLTGFCFWKFFGDPKPILT